jgi:hypothetical protein
MADCDDADKELATRLYLQLKEIMEGVPAQIQLAEDGDPRLIIICSGLNAAIYALKPPPR